MAEDQPRPRHPDAGRYQEFRTVEERLAEVEKRRRQPALTPCQSAVTSACAEQGDSFTVAADPAVVLTDRADGPAPRA